MLRTALGVLAIATALAGALPHDAAARGHQAPRSARGVVAQAAPFPSRLRAANGRIVDTAGAAVPLRGVNVIPVWGDHPGQTWGAGEYAKMAAAGLTVVRFVLYWSELEPGRGRFDPTHLATLDEAIARARAAGLHVILDPVHLYAGERYVPGWARTGDALRSVERSAHGYLRMLGRRYRRENAIAAYDLVNEPPMFPPDQNRLLRMYASLARAVRTGDRGRMVMVEPSYGNASMDRADLQLLRAIGNVVLSIHDYYLGGAGDGYMPRGDLATSWQSGGRHSSMDPSGYDPRDARDLERHLLVNVRRMHGAGVPVWIGEFGIDPDAPGGAQWIRDKVSLYKRHGVGYAWWLYDLKGTFAPLDRTGVLRPFVGLLR